MCFVALGLFIFGVAILISLLANGKFPTGSNKELRGGPAYIVSLLLIAPLPLIFLIGCGVGFHAAAQGKQDIDEEDPIYLVIEIGVVALCAIPALIIALTGAKPKKRKKKKKKRRVAADYDDYDDQPRRRRLDEDEDDDRPSRRRQVEDDEDDQPRRRRFDADDEDDDRPRRRRRFDDDD
jgi:hypothetical protein